MSSIDQVPEPMRSQLALCSDGEELAQLYLEANEEDRAGMLGFCTSGGPEYVRQLRLEHEEGTPTASDLEKLLDE